MIFIALTFLAAFAIEGLGTLVSVIGLSALFGSNPIIIALAIALDLGKIVVVSFLYTYWKKMGKIMKTYALLASAITMIITSAGASGYLSGEFQKAIMGTQESGLKVDVLKQQQAKYEERKKQIDDQVAKIPDKYTASQRIRVANQFKAEQADLQAKIAAIDVQLPDLQIKQIGVEAKAGPILYIAKAFDIPVEAAVKYVILLIIFVFDPLAVFLIIAGNFLLQHRRDEKTHSEPSLFSEDDVIEVPRAEVTSSIESEVIQPKPYDVPAKHTSDWWEDQEEKARLNSERVLLQRQQDELTRLAEAEELSKIADKISSMQIEEGDSLPPAQMPIEENRETITLSSLGLSPSVHHSTALDSVKPDPNTLVDASQVNEITPFKTDQYPRPTKKLPTR